MRYSFSTLATTIAKPHSSLCVFILFLDSSPCLFWVLWFWFVSSMLFVDHLTLVTPRPWARLMIWYCCWIICTCLLPHLVFPTLSFFLNPLLISPVPFPVFFVIRFLPVFLFSLKQICVLKRSFVFYWMLFFLLGFLIIQSWCRVLFHPADEWARLFKRVSLIHSE